MMLKQDKYYDAVRLILETTPGTSNQAAIRMVAKNLRVSFDAVQRGYYTVARAQRDTPSTEAILAKLTPIKKTVANTPNGNLREAALFALREYELSIEHREAEVAKREQQIDELRAKIATLV